MSPPDKHFVLVDKSGNPAPWRQLRKPKHYSGPGAGKQFYTGFLVFRRVLPAADLVALIKIAHLINQHCPAIAAVHLLGESCTIAYMQD